MSCKPGVMACTLLFALAVGCQKQVFLSEESFNQAWKQLPNHLENDPTAGVQPLSAHVDAPPDVNQPERQPRYLSLEEAIAIALENGLASGRAGSGQGIADDSLVTFQTGGGTLNTQSDRVQVLAVNPAISGSAMEASLSRFDATWTNSMNWTTTDNLQQGLSSFQNGNQAELASSVVKAFGSGGVANVSFINRYQMLQSPPTGAFGVVNPLYTSRLQIGFEQPLLRDYGVEINQLLARFPSITGVTMPATAAAFFSSRQGGGNYTNIGGVEGILISRLRFDQQRAEFERNIHILVLNVEVAYWNLYQAYGRLYSFEEVMRLAHKAWMIGKFRYEAGTLGASQFYPIRGQFEEFRGERMASLGAVLEAERNLRGILGLKVEDGTRLVPVTPPTMAPYQPDWNLALQDALNLRPELILARDNLKYHQFQLIAQKNYLKPDLRFFAQYSPVGFGSRLDGNGNLFDPAVPTIGPRTNNAWRSMVSDHYNDWSMGVNLSMPLGFRLEHAAARAARLQLAQSYYLLQDQEERATRALTQQYQKLAEWQRLIQARRAERKAYGEAVNALIEQVKAQKITPGDLNLLDFQRRFASASVKEYEAIAQYNNTLARFEWTKGTILQHDNVNIAEGPLPECVAVRAVDNERERTNSLLLCTRPDPIANPGRLVQQTPPLTMEEFNQILPAKHEEVVAPTGIHNQQAEQKLVPAAAVSQQPMSPAGPQLQQGQMRSAPPGLPTSGDQSTFMPALWNQPTSLAPRPAGPFMVTSPAGSETVRPVPVSTTGNP